MRILVSASAIFGLLAGTTSAHEAGRLPLGDGKVSTAPKVGYVFKCSTAGAPAIGGAHRTGGWIAHGTWDPAGKPVVEGDVAWPNAKITVAVEGDRRVVSTNSLPKHSTGEFPIRPGTAAFDYDRNPNSVGEREVLASLPSAPLAAATPACLPPGPIGVMLSGAALFDALDAEDRDAPAHEIQDRCNGHPEITRQYHYHDWSPCLAAGDPDAPVGWALDGYPILGPVDGAGKAVTNEELDACHGRTGPVKIDGRLVRTYHYRFTREFPYSIGCFHGSPVGLARK